MANAWQNPSVICKEIAYQVKNNLKFAGSVFRAYENEWDANVNGWAKGQSVDIRVPAQYTVGTTASVASGQDLIQVKRSLSLSQRRNVVIQLTSAELSYSFSRFQEEVAAPAGIRLANAIDAYMADLAQTYVANTYISTLGTVNSLAHVYGARQYLVDAGASSDQYVALNSSHVASLMPVVGTVFNAGVTSPILKDASFGRFAGADFWESQNMGIQNYGAKAAATNNLNAAYTFATNPSSGTIALGTIAITGNAATIYAGETFTLAGVYGVKALSEGDATPTSNLKQFVVATAATGASGATTNVVFYEGAIGVGPYQNVTGASGGTLASVASNTVVTFTCGSRAALVSPQQSLFYDRNAFALAVVPLAMPDSATWKGRETVDGISVRLTKGWDNLADTETTRVDVLFGGLCLNPNLACKIV